MRILVIEDDHSTSKAIELLLKDEDMTVDTTDLGEDGLEISKLYDYDIILLDLILPDMDGFDVLKKMRASKVDTPILILSGLANIDDKIKGLNLGADDYLTKPFNKKELLARLKTIVRRSKGHADNVISVGDINVDLNARTVSAKGEDIHLTTKEYGILELLALRKGTTLNKEQFLNHLYNGIDEPEAKIIDVFICKLRKKIETVTGHNYIETVWGRGYCLRAPEDYAASA